MITLLVMKALRHRLFTSCLTLISIGLSIGLLLGIERIREGSREGFINTISGTDLIVGSRGSGLNLLLYSVFHMGNPTNNIKTSTWEEIAARDDVKWTIPLSLGDSHRSFRVIGTNQNFFQFYQYANQKNLEWSQGKSPKEIFDVALGSEVARQLNYQIGTKLTLSHGISEDATFQDHGNRPFQVVGILKSTGTPIDRSLYIPIEGMEALHFDWEDGGPPISGQETSTETLLKENLKPKEITAFLLRTNSRIATLHLQRWINDYPNEAIMAILPGIVLSDLWQNLSYVENGLKLVSICVVLVGLIAMLIAIYNSLNERRREMAILRSLGASPRVIFLLLVSEAFLLTFLGAIFGIGLLYLSLFVLSPIISSEFGIQLSIQGFSKVEWIYLGIILSLGALFGIIPAIRAYLNTLSDGLTIRL